MDGRLGHYGHNKAGEAVLRLKPSGVTLPVDTTAGRAEAVSADLVRIVTDTYNHQNPNRAQYQVRESKAGIHIVPLSSRAENGELSGAVGLLDVPISVTTQKRTATEHAQALCEAVTSGSSNKLRWLGDPVNSWFAANGYIQSSPSFEVKPRITQCEFEWGVSAVTARQALIDLLDRSFTTLTWRVYCMPASRVSSEACYLQLHPLAVGPQKVSVTFDRCTNCKSIPIK